jgi:hypothetical protein
MLLISRRVRASGTSANTAFRTLWNRRREPYLRRVRNRYRSEPSAHVVSAYFRVCPPGTQEASHGLLPPLSPLDNWALGSSVPRGPAQVYTKAVFLSCTSAPPRRLHLKRAAFLRASYVDRKPRSKSTSLKLVGPTAYPDPGILFFAPLSGPRPEGVALPTGSHAVGFGYPHSVSIHPKSLGSLFQPPTLMGFALQSFSPPG